jgi:hypothetical protein
VLAVSELLSQLVLAAFSIPADVPSTSAFLSSCVISGLHAECPHSRPSFQDQDLHVPQQPLHLKHRLEKCNFLLVPGEDFYVALAIEYEVVEHGTVLPVRSERLRAHAMFALVGM